MADVNSLYAAAMPKDPMKGLADTVGVANAIQQNRLLGQAEQRNAIAIESDKIELALKQFGMVNNAAAGLLSDPDLGKVDITKKLSSTLGRLTKDNVMTAQHAVEFLQGFPKDPVRQAQAIRDVHGQSLTAWEKGKAFLGETQGLDVGGGTKFIRAPALGGDGPPQDLGFIPNTLRAEERLPQGDPNLPNYGAKSFVGGAGNPAIQPPPQRVNPFGNYEPPAEKPLTVATRRAVTPPVRRPAAPAPQAPIMSDLPAGSETAFKGAADSLVAARDAAATYSQRINPLRQALPIISAMSETDIGPTSEKWNQIKSTIQTLGAGKLVGIDPEKIANYNEAKKYLNQYTSQAAAGLGPRTNEGLAAAVTSNPNVNMDKLSLVDLTKTALGVERARQAAVLEFEAALRRKEVVPGQFGTFMAHWGTEADPRGFVYDLLDGKAQKKMLEG